MDLKGFFKTLLVATLGGAINAASTVVVNPNVWHQPDLLWQSAASGAIIGGATLFIKPPAVNSKPPEYVQNPEAK